MTGGEGKTEADLVMLTGSHYSNPLLSWKTPPALTVIEFLNSSRVGMKYTNNIFVGDYNGGNLYFFTLNAARTGFIFDKNEQNLLDRVANGEKELSEIIIGTGFGGITDIKTGPDGFLYVLTFDQESHGEGKIYQISH